VMNARTAETPTSVSDLSSRVSASSGTTRVSEGNRSVSATPTAAESLATPVQSSTSRGAPASAPAAGESGSRSSQPAAPASAPAAPAAAPANVPPAGTDGGAAPAGVERAPDAPSTGNPGEPAAPKEGTGQPSDASVPASGTDAPAGNDDRSEAGLLPLASAGFKLRLAAAYQGFATRLAKFLDRTDAPEVSSAQAAQMADSASNSDHPPAQASDSPQSERPPQA
jgi:hypothetical protein